MKARRLVALLAAMAVLLAAVPGCWDRRELEDTALVLAIGVDPAPGQDQDVSLMIAVPNKMGGGEGGGGGGGGGEGDRKVMVTRLRVPSVPDAMSVANTYLNREVSFLHLTTLVINEELVRAGGLVRMLDGMARMPALRRTVTIMASRGSAGALLEQADPGLEREPNRYLELLPLTSRLTGLVPRRGRIHHLLTLMDNPGASPLLYLVAARQTDSGGRDGAGTGAAAGGAEAGGGAAGGAGEPAGGRNLRPGRVQRQGGPNVDLVGAMVLRGPRAVGELSGPEMRVVNMLTGDFRRSVVSFPDPLAPAYRVVMTLRTGRPPQYQAYWADGRPVVRVTVRVEGELISIHGRTDYTRPELIDALEQAVSRHLAAEARNVIDRSQREWQADIVGFGYKAAHLFPTYPEWRNYNWAQRYPEAQIDASFQVSMRRFGIQTQPPITAEEQGPAGP